MQKTFSRLTLTVLTLMAYPTVALAADPPRLTGSTGLQDIYDGVLALAFPLAGLVALGYFIWGGYMWIMAAGDPQKITQAQGTLTWAVIGLVFLGIFSLTLTYLFDFLGV